MTVKEYMNIHCVSPCLTAGPQKKCIIFCCKLMKYVISSIGKVMMLTELLNRVSKQNIRFKSPCLFMRSSMK